MNLFCVSVFAAFAVFVTPAFSQISLSESDKFQQLFEAKAPLKEIVAEILTIDPFTNFEHFKTVQEHIKKNDNYAEYAKSLLGAGQKILNQMLSEIGHTEEVDIVKFVNTAHGLVTGKPGKDMQLINLCLQLNEYMQKLFEEALEEAKKKIMAKFLGIIDENTEVPVEDSLAKNEKSETSAPVEEEKPVVQKKKSQVKRTRSSGARGERKLGRSKTSRRENPDA